MSTLHRLTAHIGRPVLMTAAAAKALATRALAIDPRALARPRSGFLSQPLNALRRLGIAKPAASWDDEFDADPEAAPPKPKAYVPPGATETVPAHEGFGWCLIDGVACLAIEGPLMDRGFVACGEVFWGYDLIAQALDEAAADDRVKAVFVRMDSPGGVVAGGLEALTEKIRALRAGPEAVAGGKPIWVYADLAASAAYWIAAQADRILAPAVGLVGSIGAVIVHEDWSGAYERAGVQVTAIQFGAKKTDGADWKPLSEGALADLQAEIDAIGARFVADVTAGRPALSREALIATQAAVYQAAHPDPARAGLALQLVDEIASEEAAFRALVAATRGASLSPTARAPAPAGGSKPGAQTENAMRKRIAAVLAREAMTPEEQLDAIRQILDENPPAEDEPDGDEAEAEGEEEETTAEDQDETTAEGEEEDADAEGEEEEPKAKGKAKAKGAQNADRIAAILTHPAARGREALAQELALGGMSLERAVAALRKAPKASSLAGRVPDPALGPGGAGAAPLTDDDKAAAFVIECGRMARGVPAKR